MAMASSTFSSPSPTFASTHHFPSQPKTISFPFCVGSSSSKLTHRATNLRPISAVEISSLTLEEARIVVGYLQDKFGVSLAAEEQTEFDVVINEVPDWSRLAVFEAVRALTSLRSRKQAKELIEGLPKMFKQGVTNDEAQEAKKQLEEAGAKVSIV